MSQWSDWVDDNFIAYSRQADVYYGDDGWYSARQPSQNALQDSREFPEAFARHSGLPPRYGLPLDCGLLGESTTRLQSVISISSNNDGSDDTVTHEKIEPEVVEELHRIQPFIGEEKDIFLAASSSMEDFEPWGASLHQDRDNEQSIQRGRQGQPSTIRDSITMSTSPKSARRYSVRREKNKLSKHQFLWLTNKRRVVFFFPPPTSLQHGHLKKVQAAYRTRLQRLVSTKVRKRVGTEGGVLPIGHAMKAACLEIERLLKENQKLRAERREPWLRDRRGSSATLWISRTNCYEEL